jgi:hypothetical protein
MPMTLLLVLIGVELLKMKELKNIDDEDLDNSRIQKMIGLDSVLK